MKYLKLFKNASDYTSAKNSFSYPTVSYTIENREINMMPIHKRPIKAVFYDSSTGGFVKLYPNQITEAIPTYTPIGVEVVPAEHNVYGTGQAGIMSLAEMSYNTPDTGSATSQNMCWGGTGDVADLINYRQYNYIGNGSSPILDNNNILLTWNGSFVPSDKYYNSLNCLDGIGCYGFTSNKACYAASPFNSDGGRNGAYYTTFYSSINVFSDFDGVGNTKVLTDLATGQSDWKTASTITHSTNSGYYPAACCCWRFHTAGTVQGQWYLPAAGEFGYVVKRISAINETINKIKSIYTTNVITGIYDSYHYWTSTEESKNYVNGYNLSTGECGGITKISTSLQGTRAFFRL